MSASNFLFSLTVLHNYREKGEGDSDVQDLVLSFAALEEKVLEQYTYAKVLCRFYLVSPPAQIFLVVVYF